MADPVTWVIIASTALKAGGSIMEGNAADQAAKFEAKQIEQNATARYAQGTREVDEALREGRIVASNARAAMAASGGLASDPGAIEHLAKINEEADYNALAALYSAETDVQGMQSQAAARRFEGKLAKKTSRIKALSTVISGGGDAYSSYKAG